MTKSIQTIKKVRQPGALAFVPCFSISLLHHQLWHTNFYLLIWQEVLLLRIIAKTQVNFPKDTMIPFLCSEIWLHITQYFRIHIFTYVFILRPLLQILYFARKMYFIRNLINYLILYNLYNTESIIK